MSKASTPECFVRTIDSRRGTPEFLSAEFAGKVTLNDPDDGVRIIECGVKDCDVTISVGGKPEANRKPWEIIEKIYDGASKNCAILNPSEQA